MLTSDTRPGLDLAIQAVTRRRNDAQFYVSTERGDQRLWRAAIEEVNVCNAILADLHALRQEAGE